METENIKNVKTMPLSEKNYVLEKFLPIVNIYTE